MFAGQRETGVALKSLWEVGNDREKFEKHCPKSFLHSSPAQNSLPSFPLLATAKLLCHTIP